MLRENILSGKANRRQGGTSEQYSSSAQIIRYAGELSVRAQILGNVAASLLAPQTSDDDVAKALAHLRAEPNAPAISLSLSVKALQLLAQALESCDNAKGFGVEALVSAARVTRDDARRIYATQLEYARAAEQKIKVVSTDTDQAIPRVEATMLSIVCNLGHAAGKRQAEGQAKRDSDRLQAASKLVSVALAVLELLCADGGLSRSIDHQKLLELRAVFLQRRSSIKQARSQVPGTID